MSRAVIAIVVFATLAIAWQPAASGERGAPRRIEINVTEQGFEPSRIHVRRREEVKLVFLRKTDATCVRRVVLHLDRRDRDKVAELDLSLNQPTVISIRFAVLGTHAVSAVGCNVGGSIEVG